VRREEQLRTVRGAQPPAPQPNAVATGHERKARRDRLPDDRRSRAWSCRSCGIGEQAGTIPAGWYSVTRHSRSHGMKPARLGVSCTAECLNVQMLRLTGEEADAGDRWADDLEGR
jgi:hypothetical protein